MQKRYVAGVNDENRRLDRILRIVYPDVPLGALSRLIRTGSVRVNGDRASHNSRVHAGDTIEAPEHLATETPKPEKKNGRPAAPPRRNMEFPPIIFRNEHLLVLNKPSGYPVQGPNSLSRVVQDTAVKENWIEESLSFRSGPVHRLDTATSGVQIFSLSLTGARVLTEAFRNHTARKLYLAVVEGIVETRTLMENSIAYDRSTRIARAVPENRGKAARTVFVPLAHRYEPAYTLVAAAPATGRTHQVRVHARSMGHPLVGDTKYGGSRWLHFNPSGRHILHNLFLGIDGGEKELETAPLWTARLEAGTWNLLKELFGDPAPIEQRITALLHEACTYGRGIRTIRL